MELLVLLPWVIFLVFVGLVLLTLSIASLSAAPWVPLWKNDIRRMLRLAEVKADEVVYDLGAGDARILVIAAKEFGARSIGFEMALLPYILGYIRIRFRGVKDQVELKYRNLYSQDLSKAEVVCTFLTPRAMRKLKPKLEKETKPGCRIVSFAFKIPGWQPKKIDKPNQKSTAIYLYQR